MLKRRTALSIIIAVFLLSGIALSCMRQGIGTGTETALPTLRLATTASVDGSGLLGEILPDFEEENDVVVQITVTSSEQALTLGQNGEVDVLLVHALQAEAAFIEAGLGIDRHEVMYNDFVIVGPDTDPAAIQDAQSVVDAFARIAEARALFISRGDESETHDRELSIWNDTGTALDPLTGWYQSLAQGMRETLVAANEERAYTFTDRATFAILRNDLPELTILFGSETVAAEPAPELRNPFSVIQVNPDRNPHVNAELAEAFIEWITSPDVQEDIEEFGVEEYGESQFLPATEN